jgi:glucose/arabinose dehydrogenase
LALVLASCSLAGNADAPDLLARALAAREHARPALGKATAATPVALGSASLEERLAPSALRGADGIACREGQALVTEAAVDRLREIRADGSLIELPLPRELEGPSYLAFAEDGTLFVAAGRSGSLWRRAISGEWSEIARGLPGLSGLSIGGDHVYVSQCLVEDAITEFALDGSGRRRLANNLGCPTGLLAHSGELFIALVERGVVLRLNPRDGRRTEIASGLAVPVAVRRISQGELVVLETQTGLLRALDPTATSAAGPGLAVAKLAPGLSDLASCGKSVLVINSLWASIKMIRPWPGDVRTLVAGGLLVPQGAALIGRSLLISDGKSIKRLENGQLTILAAQHLTKDFPPPSSIAVGGDGAIYISVAERGEVIRLDLLSGKVTPFSSSLRWPTSLARFWTGEMVVAETGTGKVLRLGPTGEWWPVAHALLSPVGLIADGGRLLVAEPTGGRVISLREGRSPLSVASGLAQPAGLAIGTAKQIYIAERGTGEISVRQSAGSVRRLVTGLDLGKASRPYPREIPLLAVPDGTLLLASPGDGSVLAIRP